MTNSSCGSAYGRVLKTIARATLAIAVAPAMPTLSVRTTIAVNTGVLAIERSAKRMSFIT